MTVLKLGRLLGGVLFLLLSTATLWAQDNGWKKDWQKIVVEAKKEGRVVVTGDPDPVMRREIPAKFTAKYGISVEWIGGRGSQIAAKLRVERRAGARRCRRRSPATRPVPAGPGCAAGPPQMRSLASAPRTEP